MGLKNKPISRGRQKVPTIESESFSQIIFLISEGVNYPMKISKRRHTDISSTSKQLKKLEKNKFVKPKKEALLNKTIYSINYKRIIEEFISFLFAQKNSTLIKSFEESEFSKNWRKVIMNSPIFHEIFKGLFKISNEGDIKTIKDIFVFLINSNIKDLLFLNDATMRVNFFNKLIKSEARDHFLFFSSFGSACLYNDFFWLNAGKVLNKNLDIQRKKNFKKNLNI